MIHFAAFAVNKSLTTIKTGKNTFNIRITDIVFLVKQVVATYYVTAIFVNANNTVKYDPVRIVRTVMTYIHGNVIFFKRFSDFFDYYGILSVF